MILQEIQDDYLILKQELKIMIDEFKSPIHLSKKANIIISHALKKIRSNILQKKFQNTEDEIVFFKEILPKFLSQHFYFQTLHDMETHKPVCSDKDLIIYWEKQLDYLKSFFKKHEEFYIYVRSESSISDQVYFLRDESDTIETHCSFGNSIDNRVSTKYSILIANIISNDKICEYIKSELAKLNNACQIPIPDKKADIENLKLIWTDPKISLVEVMYAFKKLKVFNHGNVSISQIAKAFEVSFNIDLKNHPRTHIDITDRKIEVPKFINLMLNTYNEDK